ncbi:MAG: type II secretion system F family protein [Actinomycetales bacterium]|nr:type II secretion system F family protein [Actinomycetales bacterium]
MTALFAAIAGVLITSGILLTAVGGRRTDTPPRARTKRARGTRTQLVRSRRTRTLAACGIGLAVWAVSGWPVAGAVVTVTILGLPVLLGTGKAAARSIDRIEAVEEWTRRVADVLVAGTGLEQALVASLATCPDPIRPEVTALCARLSARWTPEQALRAFADDVDDAAADLVAAALVLAARRRGPGLARVLTSVADSVAEEVAVRRKVEAERAKPRATARAVTLITLGMVGVGALNGDYLAPYTTGLGQLVLAAIAAGFVACLAWMRALTLSAPEPRFLAGRPVPTGSLIGRWSR